MDELQLFEFQGSTVRTIVLNGEPWFVLNDLCAVLEHSNSRMVAQRLNPDDVSETYAIDSLGRRQLSTIVNEGGMYEVVIRSDMPRAKTFRVWLTHEVLPQIRKTGSYNSSSAVDITSLAGISAILDAGKAALNRAQAAEQRVLELEGPAAEREYFRAAEGHQLVGDVANRFVGYAKDRFPGVHVTHESVREHAARLSLIIRGNTVRNNQPTAQAVRSGWAVASESSYTNSRDQVIRTTTTRLTPRGEARLWDGLCAWILEHGDLTIPTHLSIVAEAA